NLTTGAAFSPLHLHGTTDYVTVKKVRKAYLADGMRPIGFSNREWVSSDLALRWQGEQFAPRASVFPAPFGDINTPAVIQTGTTLYMYPADTGVVGESPVDVVLDV